LPEELDPDYDLSLGPKSNKGHQAWIDALRAAGVAVIDPTDVLWEQRQDVALFPKTDTHWTPAAMRLTARQIAPWVRQHLGPGVLRSNFSGRDIAYAFHGDSSPLKTSSTPDLHVTLTQTLENGRPAVFDDSAPVLVIGDSYAQIFAEQSAGFPHLLAAEIGAPVQSKAEVGIRASDMAAQAQAPNVLEHKKVVILVFSLRKIVVNRW